jgi:hypothetical protein
MGDVGPAKRAVTPAIGFGSEIGEICEEFGYVEEER